MAKGLVLVKLQYKDVINRSNEFIASGNMRKVQFVANITAPLMYNTLSKQSKGQIVCLPQTILPDDILGELKLAK